MVCNISYMQALPLVTHHSLTHLILMATLGSGIGLTPSTNEEAEAGRQKTLPKWLPWLRPQASTWNG